MSISRACAEGGITETTLFLKAHAELMLQDIIAAEQTMALAAEYGLSTAVEEMLQQSLTWRVPVTSLQAAGFICTGKAMLSDGD